MPDDEINPLAAAVTETIEGAIEDANVQAEHANEISRLVVEGAMETERGERIAAVERRLDVWQENQNDQSQAIASLVLGMTELSSKVDLLTQVQSPTPNPPSVEVDGPPESLVPPEVVEVVPPVATEPEPPAPVPPKKKRHRWI